MKISIITPTQNSSETITRTVDSVINQTHQDFEHIIIDNLSTDTTLEIIRSAYASADISGKLKIFSEADDGITDAFNKGILKADGDIIAIINSDDYYIDNRVFSDVVRILDGSDYFFVHGCIYFDDKKFGSNVRTPKLTIESLATYHHMTMFIKKCIYEDYGLYDRHFKWGMDFEHWCRLHRCIPEIKERAYFLDDRPLVCMAAGGDSNVNEIRVVEHERLALDLHGFTDFRYRKAIFFRRMRIHLKRRLDRAGMSWLVHWWRRKKWGLPADDYR